MNNKLRHGTKPLYTEVTKDKLAEFHTLTCYVVVCYNYMYIQTAYTESLYRDSIDLITTYEELYFSVNYRTRN
jgi:hypothetical protein